VYGIAKLPEANRINSSAACTDVIGVGTLFAIGTCTFRLCEAYHYDDWQPLFHSAVEVVVQRHLVQTLTGKPELLRLADSSRKRALSVSAGSDLIWRAIGSLHGPAIGPLISLLENLLTYSRRHLKKQDQGLARKFEAAVYLGRSS
jgi:hypothetical protein